MSKPFCLNAVIPLKAERREEFLKVMISDQKGTLEDEKESVQFVIGEDLEKPNTFYLYEEYASEKAFELHNEAPHFAPWKAFCETSPFSSDPVPNTYLGTHDTKTSGSNGEATTTKAPVRDNACCTNAEYRVKPEKREEFLKIMKTLREASIKEALCLQFVWGECKDNANTFYVHDEYSGVEGLAAHEQTEHFKAMSEFREYSKPPVVYKFKTIPNNPNTKQEEKEENGATGKPFCLNAIVPLKAERREEFLKVMISDQKGTLEDEKESVQFVIGEDLEKPNTFYLYEEYVSEKAFGVHNEAPHFAPWKAFCETSPFASDPIPNMYFGTHDAGSNGETKKVPVRAAVCVNAEYCIKPEKRDGFVEAISVLQEASLKEPLCLQFNWGECKDNKNTFYVHEEYSQEDGDDGLKAHEETKHFKTFVADDDDCYSKPPVVYKFKTIPMNPNNPEIWKEDVWLREDGTVEKIVEVEEEPKHHIDYTTDYMRNITIKMEPGGSTLSHRHEIDTVIFILMENGIDFINDVMGCGAQKGHMDFGQLGFAPFTASPCVHRITNLTPDLMFIINLEILHTGPPPVTQKEPLSTTSDSHKLALERYNCRVYKLSLQPGESVSGVTYNFYYTRVILRGGKLTTEKKKKKNDDDDTAATTKAEEEEEECKMGDCIAKEPSDAVMKITNTGDSVVEYYITELTHHDQIPKKKKILKKHGLEDTREENPTKKQKTEN